MSTGTEEVTWVREWAGVGSTEIMSTVSTLSTMGVTQNTPSVCHLGSQGCLLLHKDHSWMEMDLSPSLLSTTIRIKWPHFRQWLTLIQRSYLHSEGSDTFKLVYFPTCEKCRNFLSFFYLERTQMGFKSEGSTWLPKRLDLAQQSWDLNKIGKTEMETQKSSVWGPVRWLGLQQLRVVLCPRGTQ